MKKFLKIASIVLVIGALSFGAYLAYSYYKKLKAPMTSLIDAIPNNAAFIIKIKSPSVVSDKIKSSDDSIISTLLRNDKINKILSQTDSIYNSLKSNENLISILNNHPLYISLHMTSYNEFDALFSIKLNQTSSRKDFIDYLSGIGKTDFHKTEEIEIIKFTSKNNKEFFFIWDKGILSLSNSRQLTNKQAYTISEQNKKPNSLFGKMIKSEGKDALMNVYINYDYFHRFIGKNANQKYRNLLSEIGKLSQSAVLDLSINNNIININGFSAAPDSVKTYLNALENVKAGSINFDKYLPSTASQFIAFGAKDFKDYFEKLAKNNWKFKKEKEINQINTKYKIDLESYLNDWLIDELVFIVNNSDFNHIKDNSFALLKSIDSKEAIFKLDQLSSIVNKADNNPNDTIFYRDYQIRQIKIPYLLSSVYGGFFENLSQTYYVALDDYILIGNSIESLQNYLNSIMVESTLSKNKEFMLFKENLSSESHLLFYSNLRHYDQLFSKFLNPDFENMIKEVEFPIYEFSAMSIQFLSNKSGNYTSMVIQNSSSESENQAISWQTALDTEAVWGPYPTLNHRSGSREILIADKNNMLYRINNQGNIVWKIPLTSKPLSNLFLIDFYGNGKYQYLFNSKESIYLFDLNGNTVEDFPIQLPKNASAGLKLIDYNNEHNYRIIIPLVDKTVYNFTKYGTETDGWTKPSMNNYISEEIQYFRMGNKDVIIISDTIGDVIYANRKGINRIETELAFTNNFRTNFYFDENSNKANIVTTDIAGRLIKLDFEGNVEKKNLCNLSMFHSFYYEDFDRDGIKDYIFIDRNILKVFSIDDKEIFSMDFTSPLGRRIEIINKNQNDSIHLILQDKSDNSLIFIGRDKVLNMSKKYFSDNNFIVSYATKNKKMRLITVNGRVISNYIFN